MVLASKVVRGGKIMFGQEVPDSEVVRFREVDFGQQELLLLRRVQPSITNVPDSEVVCCREVEFGQLKILLRS
jgi:hypothetical protein